MRTCQRVGQAQFDKRLPSHTDALRFAIDCPKQIEGKIDVHALDFSPWARGLCKIDMRAEVLPRIVQLVEALCAERPSLRGTVLPRLNVRGGPR